MKRIFSVFILTLLVAIPVVSQNQKDVLLTIDGAPVYANEFKRVYNKNLDLVQEESQKDIDGYLQLFIDYKLKTAEARAQGLDDKDVYKSELKQYRAQLSRNYLFEDKVTEEMAKEGIEAEVIDLRTVRPIDYATCLESVKKTNRVVIVEEANPLAGISSELTYHFQRYAFDYLDSPVIRVNSMDIPLSYSPTYIEATLPNVKRTIDAIKKVCYK